MLLFALALAVTSLAPAQAGAPPDPLAGKSMTDICNDDALLLLKFDWNELRRGGLKKVCCVASALGDDYRCQLDWPSSDVPACSQIDLLRNKLFALDGYEFKEKRFAKHFGAEPWYKARTDFSPSWLPQVAQKNAGALKAFKGCEKDLADKAACDKAGSRFSVDLQKAAKGQMDGVQQSEIADVVEELCAERFSPEVAACLKAGKGKACLKDVGEDARLQLWRDVKAISPDVTE
jgi:hypothetical protein